MHFATISSAKLQWLFQKASNEEEKKESGMKALGGLPVNLDLATVMALGEKH